MHRIQNAPNVDVEDAAVFGLGDLIQWAYPLNAGVVKSDVEAAISGDGEVDHCFNVGIFCDVRASERGGTAELLDFCDDVRAFFFTSAGEDDLGASTGKFDGSRLTDTGGPSGHQCDFVWEFFLCSYNFLSL